VAFPLLLCFVFLSLFLWLWIVVFGCFGFADVAGALASFFGLLFGFLNSPPPFYLALEF
jgi:hypothetical protein